jgi:hypothetical protein
MWQNNLAYASTDGGLHLINIICWGQQLMQKNGTRLAQFFHKLKFIVTFSASMTKIPVNVYANFQHHWVYFPAYNKTSWKHRKYLVPQTKKDGLINYFKLYNETFMLLSRKQVYNRSTKLKPTTKL